ncbi:SanA/YdcF family protein [Vibrio paucivorans]
MGSEEQTNLIQRVAIRVTQLVSFTALKKGLKICLAALLLMAVFVVLIDRWVSWGTSDSITTNTSEIDNYDVAVVLGTSKYLGRVLNEYYSHRMDAAIELFHQGKVNNLLLSGDNAHRSYNEPWTMKRDLLKADIPEQNIYLDYAGFRTLDSVVRAKEIFDTDDFLIITQRFHCERALFIAKYHDINAQCLAVPGPINHSGLKIRLREVFARSKAFLDLFIINTQPRFLGPKEPIAKSNLTEPDFSISHAETTLNLEGIDQNVSTSSASDAETEK